MDPDLRRRLDAVVALLGLIVILLTGVVYRLGGGELLLELFLVALVVGFFGWPRFTADDGS